MANDLTGNPWIIDSVMPAAYTGVVFVDDLSWSEQVNAGDQLVIKRKNGSIVIDTKAQAANAYQRFGCLGHVEGFQITTLVSGKVQIYIR